MTGGGANEIADLLAKHMGDGLRVAFGRGLAREDDDARLDIVGGEIGAGEGGVELNRLLVELYRRFGLVQTRKALNNKAYRMTVKGLIAQVEGRRGAYRLPDGDSGG